jgi:hypothetical protein
MSGHRSHALGPLGVGVERQMKTGDCVTSTLRLAGLSLGGLKQLSSQLAPPASRATGWVTAGWWLTCLHEAAQSR